MILRRAVEWDIPGLIGLMSDFYDEAQYTLDRPHAAQAFAAIIADERLGYVWLFGIDGESNAGYVVLTLKFGMEYGGLIGCIDDLYVVPRYRNRGLSTSALAEVKHFCTRQGVRALTVEAGFTNGPAQAVYRKLGMAEAADRRVLALASPSHAL